MFHWALEALGRLKVWIHSHLDLLSTKILPTSRSSATTTFVWAITRIARAYHPMAPLCPGLKGQPLGFKNCIGSFLVLMVGFGISTILLIIESIMKKKSDQNASNTWTDSWFSKNIRLILEIDCNQFDSIPNLFQNHLSLTYH